MQILLKILSLIYGSVIFIRNKLYDLNILKSKKAEGVEVICIGNIVAGGTGKTPAVQYFVKKYLNEGKKVGILSRGYKGKRKEDLLLVRNNKEIRNKINRNMNWEIANETKKLSAAEKQIKIINKIDEEIGLEELSDVLRETAVSRLENEEMSLQELADLMSISKSGIKNRFRRLEEIYKNLTENRGEN